MQLATHTPANALQQAAEETYREGAESRGQLAGVLPVERRPVRKPRGKSAADQAEALAGLLCEKVDKIQTAAVAEARYYLAQRLRELAGSSAENLAGCQESGQEHPVTDDYRAGLLLAASLVGDETFDY
jgi:hypothetical protein